MSPEGEAALIAGMIGFFGGMVTIPINAIISHLLKKEEISYQHQLDIISKKRELLLQHKLEMEKIGDLSRIELIEHRLETLEQVLA